MRGRHQRVRRRPFIERLLWPRTYDAITAKHMRALAWLSTAALLLALLANVGWL